jgi:hypothetical protein
MGPVQLVEVYLTDFVAVELAREDFLPIWID